MKGVIYISSAWICLLVGLASLESYFTALLGLYLPLHITLGLFILSLVGYGLSYFEEVSRRVKIFRKIFLSLFVIVTIAIVFFMYSLNQAFTTNPI